MPNCNNCGKYIAPTEVYRREIYVGTTRRVNYGRRASFGRSNHYRNQNVCIACAQAIDNGNAKRNKRIQVFILIVLIILFFFFIL